MTRLIVDTSSVLKRCTFAGRDDENGHDIEWNGKIKHIPSAMYGYDNAVNSIIACLDDLMLTPSDMIFVVESGKSKSRRQMIYSGYKEKREESPPELNKVVDEARDMVVGAFRNLGATVVTQPNMEADDVIAYLVRKFKGGVVFSEDGDLATLLAEGASLYRQGRLTTENPYGPFDPRFIPLMKALVGDGNEYKGAVGFGGKAWLDLLVGYGDYLDALELLIREKRLSELEDDVKDFKPFRKVIDGAEHVYQSYACALLHDEWVNTQTDPIVVSGPVFGVEAEDFRLRKFKQDVARASMTHTCVTALLPKTETVRKHVAFDTEIIGSEHPVFLVCAEIIETGERFSWWGHEPGQMRDLEKMLSRNDLTWVSFNGINFDAPLMGLAIYEAPYNEGLGVERVRQIKAMAETIIVHNAKPWELTERFEYLPLDFDHVDLVEVAPGVRISLKAYAGRMAYPTMVDLPFEHDKDLAPDDLPVLESYCLNDLGVTIALFKKLKNELALRAAMSEEYGIDLRSKSDAQVAEAVLRKSLGLKGRQDRAAPRSVRYTLPDFVVTDSEVVNDLISRLTEHEFEINYASGSPEAPDFLDEPVELGFGTYKVGMGGLHSTHDKNLYAEVTEHRSISDFDVASYYPNIMLKAGIIPKFDGNVKLGEKFIEVYRSIYEKRIEAKRSGNTSVANSLKITLNGTFGKLGSIYSAFYAPDLMLGVTITGQLNLMCLIHELEKVPGVKVLSANTDGIMVSYGNKMREQVLAVIAENASRTGFEYEETPYRKIALKDVNNYVAITTDGKVKRKGLYAAPSLMKNPTMSVCSEMAVRYLLDGTQPCEAIFGYLNVEDFVAVRAVKGGGIQPAEEVVVDDWVLVNDVGSKDNEWARPGWVGGRVVRRKSRPHPVVEYRGGSAFGRLARWYMTTTTMPPIVYAGSGNKVPKTEGARICMNLPDRLPDDLDLDWYVREAEAILAELGCKEFVEVATT